MAAIDKIYGTKDQAKHFYEWCLVHNNKALKYFTWPWGDEWEWDEQEHPITNFPDEIDRWMLDNCPIKWVTDAIKWQYALERDNTLARAVKKVQLEDGYYTGHWGGWEVEIDNPNVKFKVDTGIQTSWKVVSIIVFNGYASIYEKGE